MNEKELQENKIVCLKQLRLTKWQLKWNKEIDVEYYKVEKDAIQKAELEGKWSPNEMKQAKQAVEIKLFQAYADIEQANIYIKMLDEVISKLEENEDRI